MTINQAPPGDFWATIPEYTDAQVSEFYQQWTADPDRFLKEALHSKFWLLFRGQTRADQHGAPEADSGPHSEEARREVCHDLAAQAVARFLAGRQPTEAEKMRHTAKEIQGVAPAAAKKLLDVADELEGRRR